MIQRIILFTSLLIMGLIPTTYTEAACQVGEGKSVKTTVSFVGNPTGSSITVNGTTLSRNAAQCTSPIASGSYTVSCDTRTETLAADSVFAPLCGSAVELGKANSSCWTCGDGSLRCSGLSFALGETDDSIYLNRQSIDGGDTSQVWRVGNHPSTFTYNGVKYTHGGDLVVCTSNVAGCGADPKQTTCQSALYPDVTTQNAPSANEVVEVVGDTVHEKIEIPEILTGITNFFPVFRPAIAHFILNIWPKDDTFQSPNLEWLSNQMYQANFGPLNTKYHQDRTVHMAKLQPYSTTARLCVTNPDNGDLYTTVSEQRYESKTSVPFLLKGIEGSRGLASKMTKHREADQDFDDKQTVKIKTDEPLPCNTTDVSQNLINEPVGTINQNVFGQNTVSGAIPWLIQVSIGLAFKIEDLLNNLFRYRMEIPGYVLKTQLIRSAELDCYTGHCETADLGRVNYVSASEKQELVSSGGIVETFKPLAHTLPGPIHGGYPKQPFNSSLGDKTADTRIWGLNRTTEAGIYFNCMIEPLSKQAELMPKSLYPPTASDPNAKSACSQTWSKAKTTQDASGQHGTLPVPGGITSIIDGIKSRPTGLLGQNYLNSYPTSLITTKLTEAQRTLLMQRIQSLIDRYVSNNQWPNSQLSNTQLQQQIHDFAQQNGYNEAFLYALWLEETHASSVGDYPFGCGGYTTFSDSLNCLANDPTVKTYIRDDLPQALCMYADGHRNCDFSAHPNFIRNLTYYYDYLTTTASLTP